MELKEIQQKIVNFLNKLSVEFDQVEVLEEFGRPKFVIKTKDSSILIGKNGDHFRALSLVIKKIVNSGKEREDELQFSIDVNDYQSRQLGHLKEKASAAADRSKMFKKDVDLEPMGAYERMVVHSILSEEEGVSTESQGEGKFRHVVVRYTG